MTNNIFLSIITVGLCDQDIIDTLYPLNNILGSSLIESIVVIPYPNAYLQQSRPHSCFISDPGKGVYSAMNEGLHHATGAYVWFSTRRHSFN